MRNTGNRMHYFTRVAELMMANGSASDGAVRVALAFLDRQATEFDSPKQLQQYLKDHPDADKTLHSVKPKQEAPKPKQQAPKQEAPKQEAPSKQAPKAPASETNKSEPKDKPKAEKSKAKSTKRKSKPVSNPKTISRVGIPGGAILPPPKLPRLAGLSKDEAAIEEKMNAMVESHPDKMAQAFYDIAKTKNWVFETDGAKTLMPEWSRPDLPPEKKGEPLHPERAKARAKYNAVMHQGANAIVKKAFLSRMDEIAKLPPEQRKILVTSGGVAAGKGSMLAAKPELSSGAAATWDAAGEQNATENEWLIEECKKRGIRPTFVFVAADPKKAWLGVVERAKSIGRMVDARLFADSYAVGAKNFHEFQQKHKGDAGFSFGRFNGPDKPTDILTEMPPEALELDADDIYDYASEWLDEHKDELPEHIYAGGTIGRRIWDEV